jgi:probable phosphoglycerate mutase
MKLYYTRHGQTAWNATNRVCGVSDLPLDSVGMAQAQALAKQVARLGEVELIVASPMLRARQTAAAVAEAIGRPVVVDQRLREWDYGRLEGQDRDVFAGALRAAKREFALPLGETGETLLHLTHRVYAALDDIARNYFGQTALLVAHGGVCRVVETYFRPMALEEFLEYHPGNCELNWGTL